LAAPKFCALAGRAIFFTFLQIANGLTLWV
jgi:hypothetical protein